MKLQEEQLQIEKSGITVFTSRSRIELFHSKATFSSSSRSANLVLATVLYLITLGLAQFFRRHRFLVNLLAYQDSVNFLREALI